MSQLSIHAKMAKIKKELNEREIPKSGHNKFAGFSYHELKDFMPLINELNEKYGVNDTIQIDPETRTCRLFLTNADNPEEPSIVVTVPYSEAEMLSNGGGASKVDAIQRMGATITYNRRYLYLTAYNIQENDSVDASDNTSPKTQTNNSGGFVKAPQQARPAVSSDSASEAQIKLIERLVKDGKLPADTPLNNITKAQASELITKGKTAPAQPVVSEEDDGEEFPF